MNKTPLKSLENIQFMNDSSFDMRDFPLICDDLKLRKENFNDVYLVEEEIGRGKYAVVKRCKNKATSTLVAAKFQRKRRKGKDSRHEILSEIRMLEKALLHPCMIDLIEVFESPNEIIIVTDYASGGELFQTIIKEEKISEKLARIYVKQTLEGLAYLHAQSIVHLDVKPQNILLTKPFPNGDIKLCDFGFARIVKCGEDVRDIIGTPDFVAPEILSYEPIQVKSDMWSVGVLTYVLLTGFSPFQGDSKQETFLNISQVNLDFPEDLFQDISLEAQNFIRSLLIREPESRVSSINSLNHPWFSCNLDNSEEVELMLPRCIKRIDRNSLVNADNEINKTFLEVDNEKVSSKSSNDISINEKVVKRVSMSLQLQNDCINHLPPISMVKLDDIPQKVASYNSDSNDRSICSMKTTSNKLKKTYTSTLTMFTDCGSPGGKFLPSLKNRDVDNKAKDCSLSNHTFDKP